ncbi:MAG TPA: Fic family protein [Saprospiraceae bacterium]|nr:Fic family protein [Saprospiraceae bacterium]
MSHFDPNRPFNALPDLHVRMPVNAPRLMKHLIEANRLLAELKGYCKTLPDPNLLLNTISLQESKDSSAIENIVTTQDELYMTALEMRDATGKSTAKEVLRYREATYWAMNEIQKKGLITTNVLVGTMQIIKNTNAGIRKSPGIYIGTPDTKSVIYTPPEGEELIRNKLAALEIFMNDDQSTDIDPLIKMAMIHYQFEAIHPFADGNGRTGRILNVLYLIDKNLLELPILYLSHYIMTNKSEYYMLLRGVTENQRWTEWFEYVLKGISETSRMTMNRINEILKLKKEFEERIRKIFGANYSHAITDLLFINPYIKIKILEQHGIAKRQTASEYLKRLSAEGLLNPQKKGREIYYINESLMNILS